MESEKSTLWIVAIVAVVAIFGMVFITTRSSQSSGITLPTESLTGNAKAGACGVKSVGVYGNGGVLLGWDCDLVCDRGAVYTYYHGQCAGSNPYPQFG